MQDDFGDRMKIYEGAEAGRRLMPLLPALCRLDGKGFHNFVKGLARPYDPRLSECMKQVTVYLAEETNCCMAYTQSDEITLCWLADDFKSQIYFDGRIQKMCSILAAKTSVKFNELVASLLPGEYVKKQPVFDCRIWNVPNRAEGANTFLWREKDATKNSISMAASHYYSHNALDGKSGSEKQEMLFQKGVNWNDYPAFFKRGVFIQRRKTNRPFTAEEIDKLPAMHDARRNPDLVIERTSVQVLDMPPFGKVKNREDVVFDGAEPIVEEN